MLASQLLKILHIVQEDANNESCNFCDAAQPGSTMMGQNEISSHPNGYERTAPPSTELKNKNGYQKAPEHEVYLDVDEDDFTSCNDEEAKESVAASGVHTDMSHADSTVYTDKNILESDLPELIVCYKDSLFHAVKDICVDEGIPAENKCLTENVVGGHSTLASNNFKHMDVTEEADTDIAYEDDFKSLSYKDFRESAAADGVNKGEVKLEKDTAYDSDCVELGSSFESEKHQDSSVQISEGPIQTGEEECNAVETTTEIVCDNTLLGKDLRSETSLECLLKSARRGEINSSQQSDQISGAQAQKAVTTEELNTSSLDNLLDSGVISFNVDSSKLSPGIRDEIHENTIGQQLKSEKKLIHDDGISDNRLVINSQIKREQGESSFSVAGSIPDAVPYSGHIPFSGSISLRSDSSTTSTRSFAFPILPNEWNSSPVRMAKGDRRNLRRRRGCILGLLCCRF